MTAPRGRMGGAVGLVVAMSLVAVACGSEAQPGGGAATAGQEPVPTVGTTAESSPFAVEDPPEGYQLVLAGRGGFPQTWSSDSFGDDEPVTVLAPPGGDAGGPDAVTVSLTGYAGFEGGLDQASAGYLRKPEEFDIDGRRALYTAPGAGNDTADADLVVAVGEDLAVRVRSATGTRDELADVARRVRPQADHLLAPDVPEPPPGMEALGHADADVALTMQAGVLPSSDTVPAGERAHAAVWARLDATGAWTTTSPTIVVSTLPGTSASLAVLPAAVRALRYMTPSMTDMAVAGRPGVVLELAQDELVRRRAVVTSTPGGDALLVVASGGELPDAEVLAAVAASLRPTTTEAWDAFVVEARGGPGLRADPGAIELERGEAEGIEWLFQARVDDGSVPLLSDDVDPATGQPRTRGEFVIDPCLKLADGQRACVGPGGSVSGSPNTNSVTRVRGPLDHGGRFPGFHMVMTTQPAVTLRISGPDGAREARFHELPGGERRGAVIVTDLVDFGGCEPGVAPSSVMIDLLDAAGRPLPCGSP